MAVTFHFLVSINVYSIDYRFVNGSPANLIPRIFAECIRMGSVVVMWNWAIVARVGGVEVFIRQNLHAS